MRSFRSVRFFVVTAALLLSLAASAAGPKVYGIELVPYSRKVAEDRYQSSRDWAATVKYFKKKFAGWKYIKWHSVVNLPSVKYVHIQNTYPKRQFDGINLYEMPGGQVRMYVLPHVEAASDAATGDPTDTSDGEDDAEQPEG